MKENRGEIRALRRRLSIRAGGLLTLAAGTKILSSAAGIASTLLMTQILDNIFSTDLRRSVLLVSLTIALQLALNALSGELCGRISRRIMVSMRIQFIEKLCTMEQLHADRNRRGDFLTRSIRDFEQIQYLYAEALPTLMGLVFSTLAIVIVLFFVKWQLTLVIALSMPLLFAACTFIQKKMRPHWEREGEAETTLNNEVMDVYTNLTAIKAFSLEKSIMEKLDRAMDDYKKAERKFQIVLGLQDPIWNTALWIPQLCSLILGGWMLVNHQLTLGELLAFVFLSGQLSGPLYTISNTIVSLGTAQSSARRILEIFHVSEEAYAPRAEAVCNECNPARQREKTGLRNSGDAARENGQLSGSAVSLQNLWFTYPEREGVLCGVSAEIGRGQKIAFVGPSGCGKSTLLKLTAGLYPPDEGHISVFGRDIRDWGTGVLRERIAMVTQDVFLFSGTLLENLKMGRPDATMEQVEAACRDADIWDFIGALPQRWETEVGPSGAFLSGGQKQRISIARALLRDAPLLLLDEPTAALDAQTEANLQNALDRLMKNRTTIVVAHRLSTVIDADQIFCLKDGVIAEQGTHRALMERGGLYTELYRHQMRKEAGAYEPSA